MKRIRVRAKSRRLPDELIAEILSWLPVKELRRLRCVCKSWNTLILSDHTFIILQLRRSGSRNPHLLLQFDQHSRSLRDCSILRFPISNLVQNPSTILPDDRRHWLHTDYLTPAVQVVGSCNGLICLYRHSFKEIREDWLYFWNPATRLINEQLVYRGSKTFLYNFTFGYDISTNAFKVVHFDLDFYGEIKDGLFPVRVFTLGCNVWRNIQNLPLVILYGADQRPNDGVCLRGTLNWLAGHDNYNACDGTAVKQFVILSLDLGTEKYTQFLLPSDLDRRPRVGTLMDCLCYSYISKNTHFVMWQMKEFGVEKSWTQLLKISYQDLIDPLSYKLFPLYCFNGDTLMLACVDTDQVIVYNMRDKRAERTTMTHIYWYSGMGYVESLFSPYGEY